MESGKIRPRTDAPAALSHQWAIRAAPSVGGMDAVGGPAFGRGDFHGQVEHRLERHERRARFDRPRASPPRGSRRTRGTTSRRPRRPSSTNGSQMISFTFGSASLVRFDERAVVGLVLFERAVVAVLELVPEVVDADENAQHVGLEVEAIGLPAFGELIDLVAADAAVEDLQLIVRVIDQQLRGGEPGVAAAECGLRVGQRVVLLAAGVGDRIALEQNRLARLDQRSSTAGERHCSAASASIAASGSGAEPGAQRGQTRGGWAMRIARFRFRHGHGPPVLKDAVRGDVAAPIASSVIDTSVASQQRCFTFSKRDRITGRGGCDKCKSKRLDRRNLTEAEALPVAELLVQVWPRRTLEERLAQFISTTGAIRRAGGDLSAVGDHPRRRPGRRPRGGPCRGRSAPARAI